MFSSNTSQVADGATQTQAEAIDFDGTNDLLSRANLTGNTSSATFTFSAWVYYTGSTTTFTYNASTSSGGTQYFFVSFDSGGNIRVYGLNSGGTKILDGNGAGFGVPVNTWVSILISIDMSNTSNRRVYFNDALQQMSWASYTNGSIAFSQSYHSIAAYSTTFSRARFSNVYLDYTYRDLSVTANRRLFVTADLKPAAGQAALSPIMYLPMSDPTQPGLNQGTGGNFTLTGVVARSGRGPNQYNVPYSTLDGANDFLTRSTVPTGLVDGKQFTFQCSFIPNNIASNNTILSFSTLTNQRLGIWHNNNGQLGLFARNASGTTILSANVTSPTFVIGRNYTVTVSLDLSDSAARHIYINGVAATSVTWNTYTNDNIDFAVASDPIYNIGCANDTVNFFNGRLGAVWFNTSYIDLSVAANLAKFVSGAGINATPVDPGATGQLPTGTSPVLYVPMYGNNPGRNYGTGGDYTVISGPYTGARGPNEFWGNRADFDGTNAYLRRTSALTGVSDGKVVSGSFWFVSDQSGVDDCIFSINDASGNGGFRINRSSTNTLFFRGFNSGTSTILYVETGPLSAGVNYYVQYCFDLNNTANRAVFVNGSAQSLSVTTYTNDTMQLTLGQIGLAVRWSGTPSDVFDGRLSEFYFTNTFINFNQEVERLKFRDCFGNPTDLPSAITAATVPTPAIYMRFPPTAFGTNSGTGGNFTVNGTIIDGGQL